MKKVSKTVAAGLAGAVLGALIQATNIADKFPSPLNMVGYFILFVSIVIMAWDLIFRNR